MLGVSSDEEVGLLLPWHHVSALSLHSSRLSGCRLHLSHLSAHFPLPSDFPLALWLARRGKLSWSVGWVMRDGGCDARLWAGHVGYGRSVLPFPLIPSRRCPPLGACIVLRMDVSSDPDVSLQRLLRASRNGGCGIGLAKSGNERPELRIFGDLDLVLLCRRGFVGSTPLLLDNRRGLDEGMVCCAVDARNILFRTEAGLVF